MSKFFETHVENMPSTASEQENNSGSSGATTCARHPNEETALRCSKCETPICPRCAVYTTVGYRCPDCGKEKSATYTVPIGLLIVGSICGFALGFLSGYIVPRAIGFFVVFLGAIVGGILGEALSRLLKRKSSAVTWVITTMGLFGGALFESARNALAVAKEGADAQLVMKTMFSDVWGLVFAGIACIIIWERLR